MIAFYSNSNPLSPTRRFLSRLLTAVAAAAVIAALPASAQFNGPPQTSVPEINRPIALTTDRSILYPPIVDQVLSAGDMIAVHIFGQSDYAPTARIGFDGTVLLPLIGSVKLKGLTVTEAEKLIANDLETAGMYRNPSVSVQVTEGPNSAVTVVGEAHGIVPLVSPRRLLDILSTVGLPATASHIITINRPGVADPIAVDLGTDPLHSELADIPIYPGDTIVISRLGVVYMVGAFKSPGVIGLNSYTPLTLMQATALSGGLAFEGKYNDLHLIRTVGDHRTVVKLDVKAVLEGRAPDPILQANDILFLPNNALKASMSNGTLGTLLGIAIFLVTVSFIR